MDYLASSRPVSWLFARERQRFPGGGPRTRRPQGFPPRPAGLTAVAVLALAAPEGVRAQLVDQGVFLLYVDGVETGTEEFTIQREGTGDAQVTLATGTIEMRDGRTVTTILWLMGTGMMLNTYSAFVTGPDTLAVRVVRAGSRIRTRKMASSGEEERAYRARPSSVVFDDGVAHHHFVLNTLGEGAAVHALAPLAEREEPAARLVTGSETIQLGGERVETTRIRFGPDGGGGTAWFDGSGRLVRVHLEDRGFLAERLPGN